MSFDLNRALSLLPSSRGPTVGEQDARNDLELWLATQTRTEELELLDDVHGRVAMLVGDYGMGKSHWLQWLYDHAGQEHRVLPIAVDQATHLLELPELYRACFGPRGLKQASFKKLHKKARGATIQSMELLGDTLRLAAAKLTPTQCWEYLCDRGMKAKCQQAVSEAGLPLMLVGDDMDARRCLGELAALVRELHPGGPLLLVDELDLMSEAQLGDALDTIAELNQLGFLTALACPPRYHAPIDDRLGDQVIAIRLQGPKGAAEVGQLADARLRIAGIETSSDAVAQFAALVLEGERHPTWSRVIEALRDALVGQPPDQPFSSRTIERWRASLAGGSTPSATRTIGGDVWAAVLPAIGDDDTSRRVARAMAAGCLDGARGVVYDALSDADREDPWVSALTEAWRDHLLGPAHELIIGLELARRIDRSAS